MIILGKRGRKFGWKVVQRREVVAEVVVVATVAIIVEIDIVVVQVVVQVEATDLTIIAIIISYLLFVVNRISFMCGALFLIFCSLLVFEAESFGVTIGANAERVYSGFTLREYSALQNIWICMQ